MTELNQKLAQAWEGFSKGEWQNGVNLRDFIQKNYAPYEGDESFWLALPRQPINCGMPLWKASNRKTVLTRRLTSIPM